MSYVDDFLERQTRNRCPACTLSRHVVRTDVGQRCDHCGHKWPYPVSIPPSEAMMDRIDARFEEEGNPDV